MTVLAERQLDAQQAAFLPYFTNFDEGLTRISGGRDPLGLLPVWSAFGRKLVPNIASPVGRLEGIKAVLLILWLSDEPKLRALLSADDDPRNFFRLMEGMIEYWLYRDGARNCYGQLALQAQGEAFKLTINTKKTAVNGLYQYYRGSVRRAGLVDNDWVVSPEVARELGSVWSQKATNQLKVALAGPMSNAATELVPHRYVVGSELADAFSRVFHRSCLRSVLQNSLFGADSQKQLANDFRLTKGGDPTVSLRLDERIGRLESRVLGRDIESIRRCEPFLLVMQDVFDYLRGSPGKSLSRVASELGALIPAMRARAQDFLLLAGELDSPRMAQMQRLAGILAGGSHGDGSVSHPVTFVAFVQALVRYHKQCMTERSREALVLIEGETIMLPVAGDRSPQDAKERLQKGYPWMNDYYLQTASNLYRQAFSDDAQGVAE